MAGTSSKKNRRGLCAVPTLFLVLLTLVAEGADAPSLSRGEPRRKDTSPAAYCLENPDFKGGYGGQCTAFCWGRALERVGIRLPSWGNAQDWYSKAKVQAGPWQTSAEPKANSIAVWSYTVPGYRESGHVAFIEEVQGDRVVLSEANYSTYRKENGTWGGGYDGVLKTMTVAKLAERTFIQGRRGQLQGYIWLSAATLGETSRPGFNDSAIICLVCTIRAVQMGYKEDHGVYARSFVQLTDTNQPTRLTGEWSQGCSKGGYTFRLEDKSGRGACYEITASPVTPGQTGVRFFYCDCSGVIRANVGSVADSTSTPIEKENKDLSTGPSKRAPSRDTNNSPRPPAPPPIHINYLGLAWRAIMPDMQDFDKAIAYCSKAIELDPMLAEAYSLRGRAFNEKGNHEKAIADCSKAIELDPTAYDAYHNRGFPYYEIGDYDKAIADWSKVIELEPDFTIPYLYRGKAFYKKSDFDKAIADCSKAIELDGSKMDERMYHTRGLAYIATGDYDKAWADLNKCQALGGKVDKKDLDELRKASGRSE